LKHSAIRKAIIKYEINKKILKVFILIIILIIVISIVFLFIPKKSDYNFCGTLDAKYGYAYSTENIYGDSIDIELEFTATQIYNTVYYDGYLLIQDKKYRIKGNSFRPNSFMGKIYSSFKYIGTMEPDYNDHLLIIENFKDYEEAYVYYCLNGTLVRVLIENDDIVYGWYETNN